MSSRIDEMQAAVADVFRSFRDELRSVTGDVPFERKDDTSPVTKWDTKIEQTLKARLAEIDPDIGFHGEETGVSGSTSTYWLIDPIDGTTSFIRGLDYATNMAALIEDDVIVCAVIYDFNRDELFTAQRGKGAYKNGRRIQINTERREGNIVLYSLSKKIFPQLLEATRELDMRLILQMGGAGHVYTRLAQGQIDGFIGLATTMGLYDIAPGCLIAQEAGAEVLPYDDLPINQQFIIATPYVADAIQRSGLI